MSYIKFLSICDDEFGTILPEKIRLRYDISLLPTCYANGVNQPFYDRVNSSGTQFAGLLSAGSACTAPDIKPSLFSYMYNLCNRNGYDALYVICPHAKWYPYYDSACKAVHSFKRTKDYPGEDVFKISVVDTKSFAAGALYHAYRIAREFKLTFCDFSTMDYWNPSFQKMYKTLILTNSVSVPIHRQGSSLSAYTVSGNLLRQLDISDSVDGVKYDLFAQVAEKAIRKSQGRYVVSFGSDCRFVGNVLGRIETLCGYTPVASAQYGIASTAVLGADAFCVHLF